MFQSVFFFTQWSWGSKPFNSHTIGNNLVFFVFNNFPIFTFCESKKTFIRNSHPGSNNHRPLFCFEINSDFVTDEATFKELGVDSLDAVEIAMKLEEEFEIEIPDEDAKEITSVKAAVEYIERVLESALK